MIEENNCCVCCGAIIPEGMICCKECYMNEEQQNAINKYMAQKNAKKYRFKGFLDNLKNKIPLLGG